MTNKFYKRLPHCLAPRRFWGNDVAQGEKWEEKSDANHFQRLHQQKS